MPDEILSVTSDNRLAISSTNVYDLKSGKLKGKLPVNAAVQALSPDGKLLYAPTGNAIATVELSAY